MTNGYFSMDKFKIAIESHYLNDRGTTENALNMPPEELKKREILFVDIAKKGSSETLPDDEVVPVFGVNRRMSRSITVRSVTLVLLLLNGTRIWVVSASSPSCLDPCMCCYKKVTIQYP